MATLTTLGKLYYSEDANWQDMERGHQLASYVVRLVTLPISTTIQQGFGIYVGVYFDKIGDI